MLTAPRDVIDQKSLIPEGINVDEYLSKEWLLTNSRGGFSSSTTAGVNTRRYHGLLTAALNPPANRINSLNSCLETVISDHGEFELSSFEFDNGISCGGHEVLSKFSKDAGVHYNYDLGWVDITKSIYLFADRDAVAVIYDFSNVYSDLDFKVRPFAAMRDFHSLQKSPALMTSQWRGDGLFITGPDHHLGELFITSSRMWFEKDPQWWYNFIYRKDLQRGQDFAEDLWSPGFFKCNISSQSRIVLTASLGRFGKAREILDIDENTAIANLWKRHKETAGHIKNDQVLQVLYSAACQFVIERNINGNNVSTILAGYPWFMDWGRDAFIALGGVLLSTGRYDKAAEVLTTFASAISGGMIPNRFDDYNSSAHYNSIDASLWFINAAFEYFHETADAETFNDKLIPAIALIIESYRNGTRFGIKADKDGLITGGDPDTQLTWMDAKFNSIAFTPRYGKAVEINALWYSALCSLAEYYREGNDRTPADWKTAGHYGCLAQEVSESFCKLFWNDKFGYLNDCILPDGTVDSSLRPNQIYAVALRFSPLPDSKQKRVVSTVQEHLLSDYGLRTLSRQDPRYCGRYEGTQAERDCAYHQGTVWPHLIGPFIQAYLKVGGFERKNIQNARSFLNPLIDHLMHDGCIGSIAEIFDGDTPQKPKGCFAQAWAVAEVLRTYKILNSI